MGCQGCWRWLVGAALVPVSIVILALLETPKVIQLVDDAESAAGASVAAAAAKAPVDGVKSAEQESGKEAPLPAQADKMGSGQMFDRIAFAYDFTNKWLSLGLDQYWRRTLVQDCLSLQWGDRVLDLATGTADVALLEGARLAELNQGAPPKDSIMGLDPSSEMLRRGVAKVEEQGMKGVVRLVQGDAQDLSQVQSIDAEGILAPPTAGVATGSIDKISMSFGIRNVPDRSMALREMRRGLRNSTSSRVCILELSLPDGQSHLSMLARGFITHVVPLIGRLATGGRGSKEYAYLERSILEFPQPLDFAAIMAKEGLRVRSITSFAYGAVNLYNAMPMGGDSDAAGSSSSS